MEYRYDCMVRIAIPGGHYSQSVTIYAKNEEEMKQKGTLLALSWGYTSDPAGSPGDCVTVENIGEDGVGNYLETLFL